MGHRRAALAALALTGLAACNGAMPDFGGLVSRGSNDTASAAIGGPQAALDANMTDGTQSPIIEELLNRRSVLAGGSPFQEVSGAVLAANSRAAEADLRAAMLRSEAKAMNWLPRLGPSVSLSSLGTLATSLLVEQVLFDNGRRRAERDFAKADVEVAAVALAQDSNARVHDALELYIRAEEARDRAAIRSAGMPVLERFDYVLSERVRAGVSDRADLQVLQQKINAIRADITADQAAAAAALAELSAMSATPVSGVRGLDMPGVTQPNSEPLAVLKARAEAERAIAEATAARAGFFPALTLGGDLSSGDLGLSARSEAGLGFGMGAQLRAIEAEERASAARVNQAREDSNRNLRGLEQRLAGLEAQFAQKDAAAEAATRNLGLFEAQYRAGQRPVLDVMGVYETAVSARMETRALRYDAARLRIAIARDRGLLVNGEAI